MATLKIALPRASAFLLEELRMGATKLKEVGVAGDNDLVFGSQGMTWIRVNHLGHQGPVSLLDQAGRTWLKADVIEELPSRASHDKAVMSICRFRFHTVMGGPPASGVEFVGPN